MEPVLSPLAFDSYHRLVTSPVFSPWILAFLRLLLALYTLFTAIFILAWEGVKTHVANSYFSYFTHLSYIGLCAYFCAAGVQTFFYARSGKGYPLQSWPRALQYLHVLLYSTIVTYPILVTLVFWILLSDSSTFATAYSSWSNISQHALNTVFTLFEIFLTNVGPLPWLHLPICIVLLACYLGVAYITHATQGFYPYGFLNPAKEHARLAGYIVGIAVSQCIIFLLVRGAIVLRQRLVLRRPGSLPEKQDTREAIDA